jgi:hypothetical protein
MIFKIEGDIPQECEGYLPRPEYDFKTKSLTLDVELYDLVAAGDAAQCSVTIEPQKDGEEYPTINFGG